MKGVGAMQEHLKIAYSRKALETFGAVEKRDIADVFQTDFTDVAAVVVTDEDGDALRNPRIHAFEIPVFLILSAAGKKHDELIGQVYSERCFIFALMDESIAILYQTLEAS